MTVAVRDVAVGTISPHALTSPDRTEWVNGVVARAAAVFLSRFGVRADRDLADEAVQEFWVELLGVHGGPRDLSRLDRQFCSRLVWRVCGRLVRRRRGLDWEETFDFVEARPGPSVTAEFNEWRRALATEVALLSEFERIALLGHLVEGRSMRATAAENAASCGRVSRAVQKALVRLRRKLTAYAPEGRSGRRVGL